MTIFPRSSRAMFILLLIGGATSAQSQQSRQAQPSAPATAPAKDARVDHSAWLYKGSDLPHDPAWAFGALPNGLRYAVRRNGAPPGQVSVRVRVNAGSLNETGSQRGYAHLIEHLTFRGSRYVPDGETRRIWQRLGATFGSDSNAQTTPVSTTYKLDLPGATPAKLDESLKILEGMVAEPKLTQSGLDTELPAVLAEQREQPGPQVRLGDKVRSTLFAGQPLADRSPIGNIKTLEAATPASVRAFHDRWYRPDETVVIISGDMDPSISARLIDQHFAGWTATGPTPAAPDFGTPDPRAPATAAIVEPGVPPLVAMAIVRPWHFNNDTVIFNQKRLVDTLAARVISRRLETRARGGGSYLQASVSLDDVSRSANITSINILPIGDDWRSALRDVRAVIADAKANPPSQAEIDREYAEVDAAMRGAVETARVEASAKQADDMVGALDIRETVASPQASYDVLKSAKDKGMFTPQTVLASTDRIFAGIPRALVNTRTPDPRAASKLAAALKSNVTAIADRRARTNTVNFSALPAFGPAGTVVSRQPLPGLDIERVIFANGVRLLVYPSPSETGRVYVRTRFGIGYNALPADRPTAAWAGDLALIAGGIGKLDQDDLDALTAGRRIGLDFGIDDDAFSLAALTSPADYSDELKLMAAKLAFPAWDPAPVARARAAALAGYPGYASSPNGVIARDLQQLLRDGDTRWATPTPPEIRATSAADFRTLWEPLLASGPIEVSVFGDIKADEAIGAVARTFGALPGRSAAKSPPPPVRFPAHNASPVVRTHSGDANQAAAVIAWPTGGGVAGIAESRRLDVLAQLFSDRLFDRLRTEAHASYSPSVSSSWPVGLSSGGSVIAVGQVPPDKIDLFYTIARQIAADLVAKPVAEDELERIKGPMAQQIARAASGNSFWLQQLGGAAYDPRIAIATRNLVADYAAVTPEQIKATAEKYLRPERDWTMKVIPGRK